MKKMINKFAAIALAAIVSTASVGTAANAAAGYTFAYKGASVTIHTAAKKILKKLGKPSKLVVKKSCAYKGKDRTYTYNKLALKVITYSKSAKGAEFIQEVRILKGSTLGTKEGIKIGSTVAQMKAKYGKGSSNVLGDVYTYKKGKSKLQFVISGDKVSAIQYAPKK